MTALISARVFVIDEQNILLATVNRVYFVFKYKCKKIILQNVFLCCCPQAWVLLCQRKRVFSAAYGKRGDVFWKIRWQKAVILLFL